MLYTHEEVQVADGIHEEAQMEEDFEDILDIPEDTVWSA